jgi:hypothetical protein
MSPQYRRNPKFFYFPLWPVLLWMIANPPTSHLQLSRLQHPTYQAAISWVPAQWLHDLIGQDRNRHRHSVCRTQPHYLLWRFSERSIELYNFTCQKVDTKHNASMPRIHYGLSFLPNNCHFWHHCCIKFVMSTQVYSYKLSKQSAS